MQDLSFYNGPTDFQTTPKCDYRDHDYRDIRLTCTSTSDCYNQIQGKCNTDEGCRNVAAEYTGNNGYHVWFEDINSGFAQNCVSSAQTLYSHKAFRNYNPIYGVIIGCVLQFNINDYTVPSPQNDGTDLDVYNCGRQCDHYTNCIGFTLISTCTLYKSSGCNNPLIKPSLASIFYASSGSYVFMYESDTDYRDDDTTFFQSDSRGIKDYDISNFYTACRTTTGCVGFIVGQTHTFYKSKFDPTTRQTNGDVYWDAYILINSPRAYVYQGSIDLASGCTRLAHVAAVVNECSAVCDTFVDCVGYVEEVTSVNGNVKCHLVNSLDCPLIPKASDSAFSLYTLKQWPYKLTKDTRFTSSGTYVADTYRTMCPQLCDSQTDCVAFTHNNNVHCEFFTSSTGQQDSDGNYDLYIVDKNRQTVVCSNQIHTCVGYGKDLKVYCYGRTDSCSDLSDTPTQAGYCDSDDDCNKYHQIAPNNNAFAENMYPFCPGDPSVYTFDACGYACGPGQEYDISSQSCTACRPGYYQELGHGSACKKIPRGMLVS